MKIILSRKGWDSSSGGNANPILPDGTLVSMPIPDSQSILAYRDIIHENLNLGTLASWLSRGKIGSKAGAHLDPDLCTAARPRLTGWRPLFGQAGAAQGHLHNQGVGEGDLFLFFGWFRQTRYEGKKLVFERRDPGRHILFGWLQVDHVFDLSAREPLAWMREHPHCQGERGRLNTLYTAREELQWPGLQGMKGAGLFHALHAHHVLTAPGQTRRIWRLPAWFNPDGRESTLSYHGRPEIWQREPEAVLLTSAARGQEFVLDTKHYPEAITWTASLFGNETAIG